VLSGRESRGYVNPLSALYPPRVGRERVSFLPLVFQPRAEAGGRGRGRAASGNRAFLLAFSRRAGASAKRPSRTCAHFSKSIIPPLSARGAISQSARAGDGDDDGGDDFVVGA